MMLAKPRARNASVASPRISLNIPIKPKSAPELEPEPTTDPEVESESESARKKEVDAINARLRQMLSQMQDDAERSKVVSGWLDDLIVVVEHNVEREAARAYRESLEIKNVVNDLIERVEGEVADQAAQRAHFASQLAAEMEVQVVAEEMRRCAHECIIRVQTPTVVRRDVPAWQHGQPQGSEVVNGVSHVTMRVDARDLAPTMTLNPHAPVFTPRGFYGLS